MILTVTEEAVTVREYRFRLVQKCKNAVKCRLLGDETLKIFWGGGTAPSPDLTLIGRGTPPPNDGGAWGRGCALSPENI